MANVLLFTASGFPLSFGKAAWEHLWIGSVRIGRRVLEWCTWQSLKLGVTVLRDMAEEALLRIVARKWLKSFAGKASSFASILVFRDPFSIRSGLPSTPSRLRGTPRSCVWVEQFVGSKLLFRVTIVPWLSTRPMFLFNSVGELDSRKNGLLFLCLLLLGVQDDSGSVEAVPSLQPTQTLLAPRGQLVDLLMLHLADHLTTGDLCAWRPICARTWHGESYADIADRYTNNRIGHVWLDATCSAPTSHVYVRVMCIQLCMCGAFGPRRGCSGFA